MVEMIGGGTSIYKTQGHPDWGHYLQGVTGKIHLNQVKSAREFICK